jgi:hypothetical protein
MPDQTPPTPDPSGVPGLLVLTATMTFVGAVAIAAFVEVAAWWMLAVAMVFFLGGALIVVSGVIWTIDHGDDHPVDVRPAERTTAPEPPARPAAAPAARARTRVAASH